MGRVVEPAIARKVRVNAGLHRLVVIRYDRKYAIGARCFGAPGQLDGLAGGIRSRSGNDTNAATRDFDRGADYCVMLDRRQGGSLPGGFADHDRRDARFNLTFAKLRKRR